MNPPSWIRLCLLLLPACGRVTDSLPADSCQSSVECANPDPENCAVSCVTSDRRCAIEAKDADGDGHGTTACAFAPGDDCNDNDATVHPGAEEVCNGIDDDCDGADEMASQPLGGTTLTVGEGFSPKAVWVEATQTYAVAYTGLLSQIQLTRLDATGKALGTSDVSDSPGFHTPYGMASSGDKIGVVWTHSLPPTVESDIYFRELAANGSPNGPEILVATQSKLSPPDIAALESGWLVAWHGDSQVLAKTIFGTPSSLIQISTQPGATSFAHLASTKAGAIAVWSSRSFATGPNDVVWGASIAGTSVSWSAALTEPTPPVETGSSSPVIAAGDGGEYAIAWDRFAGDDDSIEVAIVEQSASGELVTKCGPQFFGMGSKLPLTIVPWNGGYLIGAYSREGGERLELLRVDASCNFLPGVVVLDEHPSFLSSLDIVRSPSGYLAVWTQNEGGQRVKARTFGPNLCDSAEAP